MTLAPMLSRWWSGEPLDGWHVSRKWNGIRATLHDGKLWSRHGREIAVPCHLSASLPRLPLDGELHCQDDLPAVLRVLATGSGWERVEFRVFDLADPRLRVEARIAKLASLDLPPWCRLVDHCQPADEPDLLEHLLRAEALGWEGIVARRPGSRYEPFRSWNSLKYRFAGMN